MNNFETMEKHDIETDIMRYKNNSLSFYLCILAIIFNVIMFLTLYSNNICIPDVQLGVDLLVNVIFLLSCFLAAEKVKTYNVKWSIGTFVIAGLEVLRIFWIPTKYLKVWIDSPAEQKVGLAPGQYTFIVVLLILAAVSLVGSGVIALIKAKRLSSFLAKQGK